VKLLTLGNGAVSFETRTLIPQEPVTTKRTGQDNGAAAAAQKGPEMNKTHRVASVALAGAAAAALVLLSGCTTSGTEPSPDDALPAMYKAVFDQALDDPETSDVVRQMLSGYHISLADFQESFRMFSQCMADAGYTVGGDGERYTVTWARNPSVTDKAATEDAMDAENRCSSNSTTGWGTVGMLYRDMTSNPKALSQAQLVRLCYQEQRIPDGASFSDDQFEQMLKDPAYNPSSPEATLCFWDPTGAKGLTIDMAEQMQTQSKGG